MSIGREQVLRIAQLAEIDVAPDDVDTLAAQLDRIVEYVAQLEKLPGGEEQPFIPGPSRLAWREDAVRPAPLARPPAELAPEWRDGYFVVPRLAGMEGE